MAVKRAVIWLTVKEVAEQFRLNPRSVYRMVHSPDIGWRSIKVGGKILIDMQSVEEAGEAVIEATKDVSETTEFEAGGSW